MNKTIRDIQIYIVLENCLSLFTIAIFFLLYIFRFSWCTGKFILITIFTGLTIFRGIQALDKDKPNTANSEISYGIINGNDDKKFSIEGKYISMT